MLLLRRWCIKGAHAGRHFTSHCIPSLSIVYNFHIFFCFQSQFCDYCIISAPFWQQRSKFMNRLGKSHTGVHKLLKFFTWFPLQIANMLPEEIHVHSMCLTHSCSTFLSILLSCILWSCKSIINWQLTTTYRYATTNTSTINSMQSTSKNIFFWHKNWMLMTCENSKKTNIINFVYWIMNFSTFQFLHGRACCVWAVFYYVQLIQMESCSQLCIEVVIKK